MYDYDYSYMLPVDCETGQCVDMGSVADFSVEMPSDIGGSWAEIASGSCPQYDMGMADYNASIPAGW